MLTTQISIPEVRLDTFLAFLEYLYTDHSPIEDSDSIGILELANQYVMPRLTALCELYISKHVERATSESIAQADVDIIGKHHNCPTHAINNNIMDTLAISYKQQLQ